MNEAIRQSILAWRQGDACADAILREYGDAILQIIEPPLSKFWDATPTQWDYLLAAAETLVNEVNIRQKSENPQHKYGTPFGTVVHLMHAVDMCRGKEPAATKGARA